MNEFTMTILVLGLPGIICYFLCHKLIGKPTRSTVESILLVFVYSVLSYTIVSLVDAGFNAAYGLNFHSEIAQVFLSTKASVSAILLLQAVCAGILLAYILSYLAHYNVPNRIGQKINATKRYGDEDVWQYFHNSPDSEKNEGWVMVRDLKADLAYHCYISTWSDTGMDRELVLSDVSVYSNSTGDYLYDARHIYLSRNKDALVIEVPPANAAQTPQYTNKPKEKETKHDGKEVKTTERRNGKEGRSESATADTETADSSSGAEAKEEQLTHNNSVQTTK